MRQFFAGKRPNATQLLVFFGVFILLVAIALLAENYRQQGHNQDILKKQQLSQQQQQKQIEKVVKENQEKSDRKWCDILTTLKSAPHDPSQPLSDYGKHLNASITNLYLDFHCDTKGK